MLYSTRWRCIPLLCQKFTIGWFYIAWISVIFCKEDPDASWFIFLTYCKLVWKTRSCLLVGIVWSTETSPTNLCCVRHFPGHCLINGSFTLRCAVAKETFKPIFFLEQLLCILQNLNSVLLDREEAPYHRDIPLGIPIVNLNTLCQVCWKAFA